MTQAIIITKILKSSDKLEQFHGNFCLDAELNNGSKVYYYNVKYKKTLLYITYPSGITRKFEEDYSHNNKRNFSNTKYWEVIKQIKNHFSL